MYSSNAGLEALNADGRHALRPVRKITGYPPSRCIGSGRRPQNKLIGRRKRGRSSRSWNHKIGRASLLDCPATSPGPPSRLRWWTIKLVLQV